MEDVALLNSTLSFFAGPETNQRFWHRHNALAHSFFYFGFRGPEDSGSLLIKLQQFKTKYIHYSSGSKNAAPPNCHLQPSLPAQLRNRRNSLFLFFYSCKCHLKCPNFSDYNVAFLIFPISSHHITRGQPFQSAGSLRSVRRHFAAQARMPRSP